MLVLSIIPLAGNGNNWFPFSGTLGLTDIIVKGKVVTTYDERASGKPPDVSSVVVRLVRVETCGGKTSREVITEVTVWHAGEGVEGEQLPLEDHKFCLTMPRETQGLSMMKIARGPTVAWHVEARALLPAGKTVTAKSREMLLLRHSTVSLDPSSSNSLHWSSSTDFDHVPPFDYSIRVLNRPLGGKSPLVAELELKPPRDGAVQLKHVELRLQRRVTAVGTGKVLVSDEVDLQETDDSLAASRALPTKASTTRSSSVPRQALSLSPPSTTSLDTYHRRRHRTPSPPTDLPRLTKASFPLLLSSASSMAQKGTLEWRIPHRGPYAWAVGESGTSALFRIDFSLTGKIIYKSGRVGEKTIQLRPYPVHICCETSAPPLFSPLRSHLAPSRTASTLGGRRSSDFALSLSFDRSVPAGPAKPPLPSPSATTGRRLSVAHLPLLGQNVSLPPLSRPSSGRRMSEQSEAVDAPARTRLRREAPAPLPVQNATIPSPLSGSSTSRVSRSSTIDSLGPDTPTTAEFLASTAAPTHRSPKLPSTSHTTHVVRHVGRSPRSSLRTRPRSSGSQRSSIHDGSRSTSNLSISSLASGTSYQSDQRSLTEYAGSPTAGASPLLASADGMLGLTLGEAAAEPARTSSFDFFDNAASSTSPHSRPFRGAPSPPPSEPPSPVPHVAIADISAFRDPFANSSYTKQSKVANELSVVTEMYISPRSASSLDSTSTRRASFGAAGAAAFVPASPHSLSPPPSLQLPPSPRLKQPNVILTISSDSADSSRRSSFHSGAGGPTSSRKGSVGTLLMNLFSRRGSKAQ
ncbi:proteophosphoglycan ppg4 [Rhodotorula toruloides]|uniref:Proteophosphoglycan ppg4 n=1 Tax=Rhodotorula toruloides TaxID=5286 RepID=A0A511KMM9_RHOTO|nr:proteophosphoglycan ppg4 [Rhodotorula toruloides]